MLPSWLKRLARFSLSLAILALWACRPGEEPAPELAIESGDFASGIVFHDRNENGVQDRGERGLAGVRVSDQRTVTVTDRDGRWTLPAHDEAIYFVVKPRGYRTHFTETNHARFWYAHKSTPTLELEGPVMQPTGPLPESIDFPLVEQAEPERFEAIFMGDPQPRNVAEVNYLAHDVLAELVGTPAEFAVVLGDISFDNKETYLPYNQATAQVGIPFYNVPGNHDGNYDGADTHEHYESWRTIYGPRYYSFDYGPVHFIILADVLFPEVGTRYFAGLGQDQLAWIESDLAHVPDDQLVVLAMHIPLTPAEQTPDFGRLYGLLEGRPHTLSFSAHSHTVMQGFLTEEYGWPGPGEHHHIVAGASCGRWWGGALDETNIPNASGSDGVPNGYFILTFDGNQYSARFKAARRPADYQMQVQTPDVVEQRALNETPVIVNFFAGTDRAVVEMAIGDSDDWTPLTFAPQEDPLYASVAMRESGQGASVANHIWEGRLPAGLDVGGHLVRIRATDMYGQQHTGSRILRVVEARPVSEAGEAGGEE